jgi:hypothetical protein
VLGRWLREALRAELRAIGSPAADEVTDDPRGKVVVSHVADLAGHGAPTPAPGDDPAIWYHESCRRR